VCLRGKYSAGRRARPEQICNGPLFDGERADGLAGAQLPHLGFGIPHDHNLAAVPAERGGVDLLALE